MALRKNPLESSSTAQHEAHRNLAAATDAAQAAVHSAMLDNIDTATALDEILSALNCQFPSCMLRAVLVFF